MSTTSRPGTPTASRSTGLHLAATPRRARRRHAAILATVALVAGLAAAPATDGGPPSGSGDGIVRGLLAEGARFDLADEARAMAAGRRVLEQQADRLGIDPDRFAFDHVTRSDLGVHVRGHEYRGGVAVEATSLAVHFVDGTPWQVEARGSDRPGTAAATAVRADAARAAALAALALVEGEGTMVAVDRRLVEPVAGPEVDAQHGPALVDAWRVHVVSLQGIATTVLVAAADGRVLGTRDDRRFAEGSALVFDPNPVVRLQDPKLRQPGLDGDVDTDLPSARLDEARTRLPIREIEPGPLAQGRLLGPWVDVRSPAPLPGGAEIDFDLDRSDPRFEAIMAYAHLDGIQRWFRDDLGLTEVNAEPQLVIAIPVPGFDNSFYMGGNDLMLLGSGGVDDGEDAEVIVHEYGHAVHDAQVPGWGDHPEGGAMGEGFGDFLAAAYFARGASQGFQDRCIADWDATSYSRAEPPCLRRTDTGKRWPDDRTGGVHADGELWSQYLWRLREGLGNDSDRVVRLVLTSHTFLSSRATFADAVAALDTAAYALKDARASDVVRREADRIGFETT